MKISVFNKLVFGSLDFRISTHEIISFVSLNCAGILVSVVKLQELCTVHHKTDSLLSPIIKLCTKQRLTSYYGGKPRRPRLYLYRFLASAGSYAGFYYLQFNIVS